MPEDIRFTLDDWIGVVETAIAIVGEDHVSLWAAISMAAPRRRAACATSATCR